MSPQVSFIVPCYNLADYLPECINSILNQTFEDFEIIIMDDCSPDNTPNVAKSFIDERIIYVRNRENLKHLANYNKGIGLARGEYVWLISADDRLRDKGVLEKYVTILRTNPQTGFVFCPAIALRNQDEAEILDWSNLGSEDFICPGKELLPKIIKANVVASPSALVKRKCYDIEKFPLDMPYSGDWYLWSLFALHYDIAYCGTPMVNYRLHEKSFTEYYRNEDAMDIMTTDEIKVRWRILRKAEEIGATSIAKICMNHIIGDYVARIQMKEDANHRQGISYKNFENSLMDYVKNKWEESHIRSAVLYSLANGYRLRNKLPIALSCYRKAIRENPKMWKAWIRYVMTAIRNPGTVMLSPLIK